jgi:hypothetical protein
MPQQFGSKRETRKEYTDAKKRPREVPTMNRNLNPAAAAEKIRARYVEAPKTDLDTLRELDRRVRRPAATFAYIFGSVASLVMGTGMCFAMNVIPAGSYRGITVGEDMMIPGIIIGTLGMTAAALAYPLYKGILEARRRKYAGRVVELSERILGRE